MSGILDNKRRMLDTVLTREGRRQLAQGALRLEFATFTDAETFYEADAASGSSDASTRIFFEAADLPQDQIAFEADDAGRLVPYRGSPLGVIDGKVLSGSSDAFLEIVTGSAFSSLAGELLGSSIDSFTKLYAIRTDDVFFDEEREFETNTDSLSFVINENVPFGKREVKRASVDKIESLFQDKRLSHIPNFRYLPPVNKPVAQGLSTTPLGDYPVIGQRITPLSYDELKDSLSRKEQQTIEFARTTLRSNVVCQIFEMRQDQLLKLDVIDFGEVSTTDTDFPDKRIFFVGKVFVDSFGAQTFVNLFTLIFE